MRRFEYFEPKTLTEAVSLLGHYNGQASLLAGGTDLLVEIKEQLRSPDYVVNIKKIPGLDHLTYDATHGLRIGSLTTVRTVETSPFIKREYAGLAQAARELGSIQVRNRATVAVLTVFILIAGLYSYFTLPREAAPDVPMPLVMVTRPSRPSRFR